MDSQESKQYWEECMNDSMVPKGPGLSNKGTDAVCISFALHSSFLLCSATLLAGVDERGHSTVAKLKRTCVRGGRQLSHNRSLSQQENIVADETALPDMKRRSMVCFY